MSQLSPSSDDTMPEDNPQDNNSSETFASENAPQTFDENAPTDMVVYEPKPEPQNEPKDVPPEITAEDTPQFIPQDVPENVQVNDQPRPDKGKSRESVSQQPVFDNNLPLGDEPVRQTDSRAHFEENSPSICSREREPSRTGSHRGDTYGEQYYRRESNRTDSRSTGYYEKDPRRTESHHLRGSESHRSESYKKDSHRSGSDRKDSHKRELRRSDLHKKDSHGRSSHKSSKKEGSHRKKKIDAAPEYGRPSFFAALGHMVDGTPYVRHPTQKKRK